MLLGPQMKPRPSRVNDPVKIPLFGSWRNAYLVVVLAFVIEVALFYLMSRYFA